MLGPVCAGFRVELEEVGRDGAVFTGAQGPSASFDQALAVEVPTTEATRARDCPNAERRSTAHMRSDIDRGS
jgi:hypothetical protein